MIFDAVVIALLVLVGGLLLFPVKVRFLFRCTRDDGRFEVRLFHWKLFSSDGEPLEPSEKKAFGESSGIAETTGSFADRECSVLDGKPDGQGEPSKGPERKMSVGNFENNALPDSSVKTSEEKKQRSAPQKESSDSEFLTLLLEPGFDKKLWRGGFRMLRSFFRIFRCRFDRVLVEGVRLEDYADMGMASGWFGFLRGTVPLFENWEFRMDWEGKKTFCAEGMLSAAFSFARILGFLIVSCRWIVSAGWTYLKNRRRLRKNPEAIRLTFFRRLVVRFFSDS